MAKETEIDAAWMAMSAFSDGDMNLDTHIELSSTTLSAEDLFETLFEVPEASEHGLT